MSVLEIKRILVGVDDSEDALLAFDYAIERAKREDLELVIVFTSNHTGSSSMYWQFVSDIVAACAE